jgi:hypothetical protein
MVAATSTASAMAAFWALVTRFVVAFVFAGMFVSPSVGIVDQRKNVRHTTDRPQTHVRQSNRIEGDDVVVDLPYQQGYYAIFTISMPV